MQCHYQKKQSYCIDEISKHLDTYPNESNIFYEFINAIFARLKQSICFICTGRVLSAIDVNLEHVFEKNICLDKADPVQERKILKTDEGTHCMKKIFQNTMLHLSMIILKHILFTIKSSN